MNGRGSHKPRYIGDLTIKKHLRTNGMILQVVGNLQLVRSLWKVFLFFFLHLGCCNFFLEWKKGGHPIRSFSGCGPTVLWLLFFCPDHGNEWLESWIPFPFVGPKNVIFWCLFLRFGTQWKMTFCGSPHGLSCCSSTQETAVVGWYEKLTKLLAT